MEINDKDYEEVSLTAFVTAYPRRYTNILYEKEINDWIDRNYNNDIVLNKALAPEIEARTKLIDMLLDKSNIKQVLELACGYSSRGLRYSSKGYNYVEMDLEGIISEKKKIIKGIGLENTSLNLVSGNALRREDFNKVCINFDNGSIAVINEGLLRYLTFEEKRIVAKNIYSVLKDNGGIWITSDVTPKNFIEIQDAAVPNFNKDLDKFTSRNNLNYRFKDINHVKDFFCEIGFEVVEVHPFSEIRDELFSINEYGIISKSIDASLDRAIVVVMKVKEN